jgi:hypothetical protein
VTFLEDSKPVMAWLNKHVGGSTLPERSR